MKHRLPPQHQVFRVSMGSQPMCYPTTKDSSVAKTAPGSHHLASQPREISSWCLLPSSPGPELARGNLPVLGGEDTATPAADQTGDSPGEELAANWDQLTASRWPRSRASQAHRAPLPTHLPPFRTNRLLQTQRWGLTLSAADQHVFLPPA